MDFKSYMTAIQKQLDSMTEGQLRNWILCQARVVKEEGRQAFLESLAGTGKKISLLSEEEINRWCGQVEDGELFFETEMEEYYEEGDWESDWRLVYYDSQGISAYLKKALEACYQLVDAMEYERAYPLLDRLCRLEFHYESQEEFWDEDEEFLTIEQLVEKDLLSLDLKNLSLNLLYACYQCTEEGKRVEKLYEYLSWEMCKDVKMTDVFAFGPEALPNMEKMMQQWSGYLKDIPGDRAARLLADACIYLGGEEELQRMARETAEIHPYLYKLCCRRKLDAGDFTGCVLAGDEAVGMIDIDREIRGEIAELSYQAAKQLQNGQMAERFAKAAFFSKPDSVHMLRLYQFHDKDLFTEAIKRLEEIPEGPFWGNAGSANTECRRTSIADKILKDAYRFMLGDFTYGWEEGTGNHRDLGWSSSFKEIFVFLMLLLMKKPDGRKTKADRAILENLRYRLHFQEMPGETFESALSLWRDEYTVSEEQKSKCREWLLKEIDRRTDAVVGGGHRHSYHKAAELIVVMGEILEEGGQAGAMRGLIEKYKKIHSRKSAFRREIEELAEEC